MRANRSSKNFILSASRLFSVIIFDVFKVGKKGAPGGIRTHNLLIRSQALCPLSYGGVIQLYCFMGCFSGFYLYMGVILTRLDRFDSAWCNLLKLNRRDDLIHNLGNLLLDLLQKSFEFKVVE